MVGLLTESPFLQANRRMILTKKVFQTPQKPSPHFKGENDMFFSISKRKKVLDNLKKKMTDFNLMFKRQ